MRDVVRNLVADLDLTMTVAGCRSIAQLDREMLLAEGREQGPSAPTSVEDPGP